MDECRCDMSSASSVNSGCACVDVALASCCGLRVSEMAYCCPRLDCWASESDECEDGF